jgi:Uma2 family endonuclease
MSVAITSIDQLDMNKIYSYADYFSWKFAERLELIKGKIYEMSPAPSRIHQDVSLELAFILKSYFKSHPCNLYIAPFDVRFPKKEVKDNKIYDVVQPDLCIICDSSKLDDRGCIGAPDLIVEILSPGNSKKELQDKYDLYLENGVKEYWIIHPSEQTLLIYKLENNEYKPSRLYSGAETIGSSLFPDLAVDLNEVFADQK